MQMIETGGPGGAENVLIRLSTHLMRRQSTVVACLLKDGWLAQQLRDRGIDVAVLPTRAGWDWSWPRRAMQLVRRYGIDALHAHEFTMNVYGAILGRLCGIPCVATVHGAGYYADKLRRRLAYRAASRVARFVAVSAGIKRYLESEVGMHAERVEIIYNGIDTAEYAGSDETRERLRAQLGLGSGDVAVGAIGSLYAVKGHVHLVRAAPYVLARHANVKFFIAGRGDLADSLQREIGNLDLGSRFELLGFRADVKELLQALDIYVMPSHAEGLPLSLLEAMAAGKPVVASRVGGIPEVVEDGRSGVLVEPRAEQSLAQAITQLIDDPARRAAYAERASSLVASRFDIEEMTTRYLALYRSLARERGR
jgi:glycosyltransferase involved in cell wall biosynthesis